MVRPAAIAAAIAAASMALPGAADAAAISVTTAADAVASDGACSLREAVQAANTDAAVSDCPAGSGADQISLGATTYKLTGGELLVTSELTITGAGAASTTIDGNHNGRVLDVTAAGNLTLDGVLITGGLTTNGGNGADRVGNDPGVSTQGGLGGDGGHGGGIANAGTLTIDRSRVSGNVTGNGGNGGNGTGAAGNVSPQPTGGFGEGGTGGSGGKGGGVYSTGTLTILSSTIDANTTGNGGTTGNGFGGAGRPGADSGGGFGGFAGEGGRGGGVYADGMTTINASRISGNTTGNGGLPGDGHGGDGNAGGGNGGPGLGGEGGSGGHGGGIWFDATLTAFDDTISGNTTGGGNHGGQGFGGNFTTGNAGDGTGGPGGAGGFGGGVFAASFGSSRHLDLERSLLVSNHTGSGGQGGTGWPGPGAIAKGGNGGPGGSGGGLGNQTHLALALNVTFTGNGTGAGGDRGTGGLGNNGPATYGNGGAGGDGGAAWAVSGTLDLVQATVTGNSQGTGGAGATPGVTGAGSLRGNGVPATFSLINSIVDGTCRSVADGGGNLVTAGSTGCLGTLGDPKLGQLQDNGGPAQTMAIGTTGDAIDKLNLSGGQCGAATDQRGAARPSLVRCDIGAYEVAPPIATTGDATAIGATSASPGGTLDPRGLRTRWYFEYGTSSSYGNVTADQFASAGSAAVAATLNGLTPETTYHYRLVGVGPDGTSMGADRTFTTTKVPPGGGGGPGTPVISKLLVKPKKFPVSGKKKKTGTTISYNDTLAATTTLTVLKPARGVKVKGRCLKPTKKRHGKRCTRYVTVGSFKHNDVTGANRFHFSGRLRGRKLKPGSYRLRAVPVAGTLKGKAVTTSFRVVR